MSTGKPRICILTSQYFNWGKYGGFGSMSRKLAEGLARNGYSVWVIVPRRQGQDSVEVLNGVTIRSFASLSMAEASSVIKLSDADIFHSQDPTMLTFLAQRILPKRSHVVTCRDPRDRTDWWIEFRYASAKRRLLTPFNYLTESSFIIKKSVQVAQGVFCPAHFLKPKIKRMFDPHTEPQFLPNLIDVPATAPRKSDRPTFAFIARWDLRKRPEKFLELAKRFPDYRFISVGQGEDVQYDSALRAKYRNVANLEMVGFVNRFDQADRMQSILGETWALVSTAAREGLPLTFLEAAAFQCAIVSAVDPDGFATQFGVQVRDDDFEAGLRHLLADSPLEKGRRAYEYVRKTYEQSQALDAHIQVYERLGR
jgi:glycosyltransferase involved in cell wall biosynthesis